MPRVRQPIYRPLLRNSTTVQHTCVVAGPDRETVWLYVHAAAPTVLRLNRDVVGFLCPALALLASSGLGRDSGPWFWNLEARERNPALVITGRGVEVRLHVFTPTPTAVALTPPVVQFLVESLADLPSRAPVRRDALTDGIAEAAAEHGRG